MSWSFSPQTFLCLGIQASNLFCHKPNSLPFPSKRASPPAKQITCAVRHCLSHVVFLSHFPAMTPFVLILDALLSGTRFQTAADNWCRQVALSHFMYFDIFLSFFYIRFSSTVQSADTIVPILHIFNIFGICTLRDCVL